MPSERHSSRKLIPRPGISRNTLCFGLPDEQRIARLFELDKKDWLNCHWLWYVEDAEHMAQLSRDNARLTQADEWQEIAEKGGQSMRSMSARMPASLFARSDCGAQRGPRYPKCDTAIRNATPMSV